jgi:SnoaL-like domain
MPEVSAQGDASQPDLTHISPVVTRFFDAFAQSDWQTMARCYHDKASFSDPIYPDLREERIVYMWHQLLGGAQQSGAKSKPKKTLGLEQLKLEYRILFGDERKAQVGWTATYVVGGRSVSNEVLSTLAIWDDKIVRHVDEYNFWRWSRQALGLTGLAFGAMPWYQRSVQRSAQSRLDQAAGTIGG